MPASHHRIQMAIRGAVQGIGFRPFVYRLAKEIGLKGWIENGPQGVLLEVEGTENHLSLFQERLKRDKPSQASIQSLETTHLDLQNYSEFEIRPSNPEGPASAIILPDISTCRSCLNEIFDSGNRRYRYPFTNCTNCGPRYSIIKALPYDRDNTTMGEFEMCPLCDREYLDPMDRRFHAQPNACPDCGPQLQLLSPEGSVLASKEEALMKTTEALIRGGIIALKGIGGFQILVRADSEEAVNLLRIRKKREFKPFALLFPTFESVFEICHVSNSEAQLLKSPEAPIVLLKQKKENQHKLAHSVAPGNPYLGVVLPYSPLHHLLADGMKVPLVATSGNLSNEPICISNTESLEKLGPMVDYLLVHDRPIERQVDDSIARIIENRELILRRARGYAPLPIPLPESTQALLALGAQQKNSVAIAFDKQAILSQHIGDLGTLEANNALQKTTKSLINLYQKSPVKIICDKNPDYHSSQYASEFTQIRETVQHHYAHVLSCMLENRIEPPVLGIAWDGTGLGDDGTLWGSEFLEVDTKSYQKVIGLRPFML
ncbi:MAG: carbamoyltransferase HypF, partial [Proteobacteria bacterium]|nr:carbamoyltransferase HypF [Pseudomonadota bacterium]